MNNCFDKNCIYSGHEFKNLLIEFYCHKLKCEIDDAVEKEDCEHFKLAETCLDCKYSLPTTYETGTIDDIEYRCPFQNNKLIYDDLNPVISHYNDIPQCNINKFEL